jgi:MerR family mercuric resistance operon transcriptional regulator
VEIVMDHLTIGQVAKNAGVNVETIRFYEREGLIGKPPRRPSGYRQYQPDIVRRIRFIQRAKELGFSLREITELLSLRVARGRSCADVKARASAKIEDVESKIAVLERMKGALTRLTEACAGRGSVGECPILDALDADEKVGT